MHRIDNGTQVATLPTPIAGSGAPGFFSNQPPGIGVTPTILDADWANEMQEELVSVLTAAGVTPTKGQTSQVLAASRTLFGGNGSFGALNGYMTLAGGLILQWGTGTTVTGNGDQVTFPVTFPNAVFRALACEGSASGWGSPPNPTVHGVANLTTSGFKIYAAKIISGSNVPQYQSTIGYNWIATGH